MKEGLFLDQKHVINLYQYLFQKHDLEDELFETFLVLQKYIFEFASLEDVQKKHSASDPKE